MATIHSIMNINGSLAGITLYQRRDIDKLIAREKAGPTKKQMEHDPNFALTRKNYTEWDGCAKGSKWIRRVLKPLDAVRDYNMAGTLTGLLKPVQKLDTTGTYGQRSVLLSQHPHLLEGFTLSRKTPFDSLVRTPVACSVQKDALSACVEVPQLLPGVNFFPHTQHPFFRVLVSLGVVPDLHYSPHGYTPAEQPGRNTPVVAHTGWMGVKSGCPETLLELALPNPVEFPSFALVLAVAITLGTPDAQVTILPVNYSGSGRIIKVV